MSKKKKEWLEIWFAMAGGSQTELEKIKSLDVFEYYTVFDLWRDRIKEENARRRQAQHASK